MKKTWQSHVEDAERILSRALLVPRDERQAMVDAARVHTDLAALIREAEARDE